MSYRYGGTVLFIMRALRDHMCAPPSRVVYVDVYCIVKRKYKTILIMHLNCGSVVKSFLMN